ncbi:hypothetical protein [Rhodococcoides fascians]|nr:hypothetical protein [Rhodococcus fascians]
MNVSAEFYLVKAFDVSAIRLWWLLSGVVLKMLVEFFASDLT